MTPRNRGVSVVVCCFNSEKRIEATLRHLAEISRPKEGGFEALVVDNASTDATVSTVTDVWRDLHNPFPLRIVTEQSPGLSNARIKGIKEATFDSIIFCDDDNWLASDYALIARDILDAKPSVAIAGGCTEAVFESPADVPTWFPQVAGGYAIGGGPGACALEKGDIVWGAGMVCRTITLVRLLDSGFSFISTDRRGKNLSAGGDSELCQAIQFLGYTLYHDNRLILKHWIPRERLQWRYVVRLTLGFGAATVIGDPLRIFDNRHQKVKNLVRKSFLYQLLRSAFSLAPHVTRLRRLYKNEGDIANLAFAPKLGRLIAIAQLNRRYGSLVERKVSWMATVSRPMDKAPFA